MGASGQIRQWSRLGDDKHLFRRASGESRRDRYWRLKRELNEKWGLGVEGYSEIEDLAHAGSFDDQAHRLGPVAYYEFPHAEGRAECCWRRPVRTKRCGLGLYLQV